MERLTKKKKTGVKFIRGVGREGGVEERDYMENPKIIKENQSWSGGSKQRE